MKYISNYFKVIHWDFPFKNKKITTPKTDMIADIRPLIKEKGGVAIGFRFIWKMRIYSLSELAFNYVSEEHVIIIDLGNPTAHDIKEMARKSYDFSKNALEKENLKNNLNATLDDFNQFQVDFELLLSYLS